MIRKFFMGCVVAAVAAGVAPVGAQAPVSDSVGVVLIAHGADDGWNAKVDSLAAEVHRRGIVRGPIATAYLMGPAAATHRFQDAVASLVKQGAKQVVVVPVLVSSYSGHYEQIRYVAGATDSLDMEMMHHLHMSGIERYAGPARMIVTPALDDSPELAATIAARAKEIVARPAGRALFLLGHGPNSAEDYAAWMANLRPVADSVKAMTGFASVSVELVRDDAPAPVRAEAVKRARELIELQHAATGQDVAVVPILVSSGSVSNVKVPADIAGLPVIYTAKPLLADRMLAVWVERRTREAVAAGCRSQAGPAACHP
jgi:sirohydrochlorin ferrochelatase